MVGWGVIQENYKMGIIKKGTMRPMKKIIGIAIGIAGLGLVFNISFINNIILSGTPKIVFGVIADNTFYTPPKYKNNF